MKYKFVPYDKRLVSRARELRKDTTDAEEIFWDLIRSKKFKGFKFTRQKPIGTFILDFYCARLKLGVEIDGRIHAFQKDRDKERDNILKQKFGVVVLRYANDEVLTNSEVVVQDLIKMIQTHP
jgi:very-short-patch-repair endonuclease